MPKMPWWFPSLPTQRFPADSGSRPRGFPTARAAHALSFAILALVATPAASAAKQEPPSWLSEAASMEVPAYDPKVPAVVLHDEEVLTVRDDGRVQGVARYAVRILRYEGRQYATARWYYETDGASVRQMNGWLIRPQGKSMEYEIGRAHV